MHPTTSETQQATPHSGVNPAVAAAVDPTLSPTTATVCPALEVNDAAVSSPRAFRKRKATVKCQVCGRSFAHMRQLEAHHHAIHENLQLLCEECGEQCEDIGQHRLVCSMRPRSAGHTTSSPEPSPKRPRGMKSQVGRGYRSSMQDNAEVQTYTPTRNEDILFACKELEPPITDYLTAKVEGNPIKWYAIMKAVFTKPMPNDPTQHETQAIHQASATHTALQPADIHDDIPATFQAIHNGFQEFQRQGSGWTLDHVEHIEVHKANVPTTDGINIRGASSSLITAEK